MVLNQTQLQQPLLGGLVVRIGDCRSATPGLISTCECGKNFSVKIE